MTKQTRTQFPSQSSYVSSQELVHGDKCGPISPPTPSGKRYFLLLVDEFSRMMWVYILSIKDKAFESFKNFKMLVENGSEKKIKALRTDRRGKFCSSQFTAIVKIVELLDISLLLIPHNKMAWWNGETGLLWQWQGAF